MLFEQRRRLRESITMKKKEILEKFEAIKKKNHSGEGLQKALDELVPQQAEGKQSPPPAARSPQPTEPQPQIFTTAGLGDMVAVETKPTIARSTLPQEGEIHTARGKRPTEESKRQKVVKLQKKLAEELRQRALAARDKEAERLQKLNSTIDPQQRERLESQFEMERARVIQQLHDIDE